MTESGAARRIENLWSLRFGFVAYAYDPELAPIVPMLPSLDIGDPVAARAALAELIRAVAPEVDLHGVEVDDHLAPQADGPDVRVRVFRPEAPAAARRPAVLHIHGGGFVVGSIDDEGPGCVAMARELDVVVVSVEYRLAPEHPYPAGLDDCYAALCWLHGEADALGVDRDRLAVYGQSAGGGLAAGLALLARDRGGPAVCFQFLGIPELDDRLETASMRAFVDTPLWNRPAAVLSWQHYLGGLDGSVPPYAAPARAEDLRGLPPAYVTAMEFDPLRDEAIDYAARMLAAGVPVELHVYPGTFHGSVLVRDAAVSRRILEDEAAALRRALTT